MSARTKFSVGAVIIVGALVWLGWVGASQSKTYYHTISELSALQGPALHQRMRVSSYVGDSPLPDTFKGGAQALAEGKLMPDGRFVAEQVQAKCASKYQATPGQGAATPAKSTTQAMPQNAAGPRS